RHVTLWPASCSIRRRIARADRDFPVPVSEGLRERLSSTAKTACLTWCGRSRRSPENTIRARKSWRFIMSGVGASVLTIHPRAENQARLRAGRRRDRTRRDRARGRSRGGLRHVEQQTKTQSRSLWRWYPPASSFGGL